MSRFLVMFTILTTEDLVNKGIVLANANKETAHFLSQSDVTFAYFVDLFWQDIHFKNMCRINVCFKTHYDYLTLVKSE